MGRIGEIGHADVQALIAKAAQAAHAAGKPIGIVGANPDMLGRFLGYGYDWGAVASDLALMSGRAADWVTAIKGRNMGPTTGAAY
jgi:4-hydroxy-2-oxoheptanedioate aldolase